MKYKEIKSQFSTLVLTTLGYFGVEATFAIKLGAQPIQ